MTERRLTNQITVLPTRHEELAPGDDVARPALVEHGPTPAHSGLTRRLRQLHVWPQWSRLTAGALGVLRKGRLVGPALAARVAEWGVGVGWSGEEDRYEGVERN